MTSAAHGPGQHSYGIAEAVVVDNIDPLSEGRVKLQFPWLDASMETEWCRVCQPYAGNHYGAFFVPEKGDEVLVSFVHGDMRSAIVLGGLYNGKDKPPSARKTDPPTDQKMIRTKGKHELLFDDTAGEEKVQIRSSKAQVLLIDDKQKLIRITTGQGQSITLEQSGTITISTGSGAGSVKVDGQGSVTVRGAQSVTVSGASVKLEAGKVELGKAATEQVLLGTTFLARFNTHTHTAGPVPTTPPVTPLDPSVLSSTVTV